MATFKNFVFDTSIQNPPLLGVSLSSSSNSVVLNTVDGILDGSGKTVKGILYNTITSVGSANVTLSAATGIVFSVNDAYHNSTVALYFSDRSSTLFTVNTATTGTQVVTNPINYDNRGPIEIRRFAIEG